MVEYIEFSLFFKKQNKTAIRTQWALKTNIIDTATTPGGYLHKKKKTKKKKQGTVRI